MIPDKIVCKKCEFFKEHTCSLVNLSKALALIIEKQIRENKIVDVKEIFSSNMNWHNTKTDKIKDFLVPETCPFYLEHLLTDKK